MQARDIAVNLCYQLQPLCVPDRLNIAGSVRRKKQYPKDIEIVCVPKTYEEKDLFEQVVAIKRNAQFMELVVSLGKVIKGKPSGRMMQIKLKNDIVLDLFMPQANDYYRQYAIRTGSSQYSNLVIATSWKRMGWCGTEDGLRLIKECQEIKLPENKRKWICRDKNPTLPPVWNSEEEFFAWLGIPFLNPVKRSM